MKTFITIFTAALMLSACASINPQALQKARVQCVNKNPVFQTSIKDYYDCVQKRTPFGAYKAGKTSEPDSNQKKDKIKSLITNSDSGFDADIDFLYSVPAEDHPWLMMDLAVYAMVNHEIKLSRYLLEKVAASVETIYGNSQQAKEARLAFSHEAEKLFIGETHERAMVFHYLGLLDLALGDYQNARAAFRASLLQDSIALNKEYEVDFASSLWLQGWAAHCAGSRQSVSLFNKAKKIFNIPPAQKNHNLLVVSEIGRGPFKRMQGKYGEKLTYANMANTKIETKFQPSSFNLFKANNIHFQAVTRGDRSFDDYLASKAANKETAENIAEGALIAGLVILDIASRMRNSEDAAMAALIGVSALAVAGISGAVGAAINPIADIRTWRSLPREIYIGSFQVPANTNSFSSLKNGNRKLRNFVSYIKKNERAGLISANFSGSGTCRVLWVKDISTYDN